MLGGHARGGCGCSAGSRARRQGRRRAIALMASPPHPPMCHPPTPSAPPPSPPCSPLRRSVQGRSLLPSQARWRSSCCQQQPGSHWWRRSALQRRHGLAQGACGCSTRGRRRQRRPTSRAAPGLSCPQRRHWRLQGGEQGGEGVRSAPSPSDLRSSAQMVRRKMARRSAVPCPRLGPRGLLTSAGGLARCGRGGQIGQEAHRGRVWGTLSKGGGGGGGGGEVVAGEVAAE